MALAAIPILDELFRDLAKVREFSPAIALDLLVRLTRLQLLHLTQVVPLAVKGRGTG